MAEISAGRLYEMNQQIMDQSSPLNEQELENAKKTVKAFFMDRYDKMYFMLLCKERSDYTVFSIASKLSCGFAMNELMTLLQERGQILSIEKNSADDSSLEIWVKCSEDNKSHAYYLFDYDWGVITC